MYRPAAWTRQLTLALLACLMMVLPSARAVLSFGHPGHMALEVSDLRHHCDGKVNSPHGHACTDADGGCGGCISAGVLNVPPNLGGCPERPRLPPASAVSFSYVPRPAVQKGVIASSSQGVSSPPFLLESLRTTILRI